MRFLCGAFTGSLLMCVVGQSICDARFRLLPTEYPEYRAALADADRLRDEVYLLQRERAALRERIRRDAERRSGGSPVNPTGEVVPVEDRIPVPKELFPVAPARPEGAKN